MASDLSLKLLSRDPKGFSLRIFRVYTQGPKVCACKPKLQASSTCVAKAAEPSSLDFSSDKGATSKT